MRRDPRLHNQFRKIRAQREGQTISNPLDPFRLRKNLSRIVAIAIIVLMVPPGVPQTTHYRSVEAPSSPIAQPPAPVYSVGDTWRYLSRLTRTTTTEQFLRIDNCKGVPCFVDQSLSPNINDTVWLIANSTGLYIVKEFCTGCSGPNTVEFDNYTTEAPFWLYPLYQGKSWWTNETITGWSINPSTGNRTFSNSVSQLRQVLNETTVTVPAGTIDTFLVAIYAQQGTVLRGYRWTSNVIGENAKLLTFNNNGAIVDDQVLISYSLASPSPATRVNTWARTYGGTGDESGADGKQTRDGGYIEVGSTTSFGTGIRNVWAVRLDPDGGVIWQRAYGGTRDQRAHAVVETPDGGFVVAGTTTSFVNGRQSAWLLRLDSSGNVIWQKAINGTGINVAAEVAITSDNGYIVTGYTNSTGGPGFNVWTFKLDSNGQILWQKTYGGLGNDVSHWVIQTSDGGFLVVGGTTPFGVPGGKVLVLKLDSTGKIQWQRTYGNGNDHGITGEQTLDGGYVITGWLNASTTGNDQYAWILRLDPQGNMIWQKGYGGIGENFGVYLTVLSDGGFLLNGITTQYGSGGEDLWLLRLDSSGNAIWQKTYGGSGNDDPDSPVFPASDGGYAMLADTTSFGAGSTDFWALKTDSNGNIQDKSFVLTSYAPAVNTNGAMSATSLTVLSASLPATDTNASPVITTAAGLNHGDTELIGDIYVYYNSNDTLPQPGIKQFQDTRWITASVQTVVGTNVTLGVTFNYKNGTQSPLSIVSTDVSKGSALPTTGGPPVIAPGLGDGAPIPNWQGLHINYTTSISYLGTPRIVDVLNLTYNFPSPSTGTFKLANYYDRATGLILETLRITNGTYLRNGFRYYILESLSARIVSTNIWPAWVPGVKIGDWAKYGDISGYYQSNIPGDQNPVPSFQDVYWDEAQVLDVSGSNVTFSTTVGFGNATGVKSLGAFWFNTRYGYGNATRLSNTPFLLGGNLRAGDPAFNPAYAPFARIINETMMVNYLGVQREVNIINVTSTITSATRNAIYKYGLVRDQATGILLEFSFNDSITNQTYASSAWAHARITETNIWAAATHPDFTIAAQPNQLSVPPGSTGTTTITLTSRDGFADTVRLATTGTATGITIGSTPTSLTISASHLHQSASFQLAISAGSDAGGSFTVTVSGTSGSTVHQAVLRLLINTAVISVPAGTNEVLDVERSHPEAGIKALITLNASAPVQLEVTKLKSNPGGSPPHGTTPLGVYLQIKANVTITLDARIRLYYTTAQVEGLDASTIKLYYWDGTNWVALNSVVVNTSETWVEGTVHHFSLFALFASTPPSPTPNQPIVYQWLVMGAVAAIAIAAVGGFVYKKRTLKRTATGTDKTHDPQVFVFKSLEIARFQP